MIFPSFQELFRAVLHICILEPGMNKSDVVAPILKRLEATANLDEEDRRAFASLPMPVKQVSNGDRIVAPWGASLSMLSDS